MTSILQQYLHDFLNGDAGPSKTSATVSLTVFSVIVAGLLTLYRDFAQTFLKKPSHFVHAKSWGWKDTRPPAVKAPMVEAKAGEDYRDVLARGSKMVG